MKKYVWLAVVTVLAIGAVFGVGEWLKPKPFTVSVVTLEEKTVQQTVKCNGKVEASDSQEVYVEAPCVAGTVFVKEGQKVNLERGMLMNARLDGHIVQGHVDQVAKCVDIREANGSKYFTFQYDASLGNVTIEKGSITVDGTSLTVVDSQNDSFSVAIIPYTLEYTQFGTYAVGDLVNLEFDVIGKYVKRLYGLKQ